MSLFIMILLLCLLLITITHASLHAVLIAGSQGYDNYRHHADVCHAYHLLQDSGVQNIITLLYDNVAQDPQNPFPGTLFNRPSNATHPGIDVYQGVHKDYVGKEVTAHNFLSVLTGQQDAVPVGHPVLHTNSSDRIFIAFFDHGGTEVLGVPVGPLLTRTAFLQTLTSMWTAKKYLDLVLYVEACEGGSMFVGMSSSHQVYVVTAANATQPSWGDFCPPNDLVYFNGTSAHIGSCLGDTFSNQWMENLNRFLHHNESLLQQFQQVAQSTSSSNVSRYGSFLFQHESIHAFERRLTRNCVP